MFDEISEHRPHHSLDKLTPKIKHPPPVLAAEAAPGLLVSAGVVVPQR